MNMNTGSPNFSRLLSILALKRHEQPPPGYFHVFSGQVISRIRAGERAADPNVLQLLLIEWPWLQRLWIGLESKPALTGLLGAAACVLALPRKAGVKPRSVLLCLGGNYVLVGSRAGAREFPNCDRNHP
jgi:hypothetical protein